MKTLLIAASLVVVLACSKDENLVKNYTDSTMTWIVGHDHSADTSVILPTSAAPMNYLSVDNYSICGNTNLQILVKAGDQVLLDTIYQESFTRYPIANQPGKNISVQSKLVSGDSLIVCFWLGQATLKYEYGE